MSQHEYAQIQMNKINSIYATEVFEVQPSPLKATYLRFSAKLDQHIKQAMVYKKHEIIKQSSQMMDQIRRIKQQSGKCKNKIYESQRKFQQEVESLIRYDINKWQDYQNYFKTHFQRLEQDLKQLRLKNKDYKEQIKRKIQLLKSLAREHTRVQVGSYKKGDNLTTKQSSIRLSYSDTGVKRLKTQVSLPVLKQLNRYQRIKTLQSEYQEQGEQKLTKRYMQKIGTVKEVEHSSLPLLLELLQRYKTQEATENNWFLKILYNARHFKKLKTYLQANSTSRKITRLKP